MKIKDMFRQKVKDWIGEFSKADFDAEVRFYDAIGNEYYVFLEGEKYLHRNKNFLSLKVQKVVEYGRFDKKV